MTQNSKIVLCVLCFVRKEKRARSDRPASGASATTAKMRKCRNLITVLQSHSILNFVDRRQRNNSAKFDVRRRQSVDGRTDVQQTIFYGWNEIHEFPNISIFK